MKNSILEILMCCCLVVLLGAFLFQLAGLAVWAISGLFILIILKGL